MDGDGCVTCVAGAYCVGGTATSYTTCSAGTYSTAIGATDSSTCQSCPAGYFCTGGSDMEDCPAGGYCPEGSSSVQWCGFDSYSSQKNQIDSSTCQPCAPGTWTTGLEPAVDATACISGTWQMNVNSSDATVTLSNQTSVHLQDAPPASPLFTQLLVIPGSTAPISLGNSTLTAWLSGENCHLHPDSPGVYLSLRVPSDSAAPSARRSPITWVGTEGDLYLFGGFGPAATFPFDLWR
jgi:hypothetical protein